MSSSGPCWQGCNLLFPAKIGILRRKRGGKGKKKKRFKWKEQIMRPLCVGYMNSVYFIHSSHAPNLPFAPAGYTRPGVNDSVCKNQLLKLNPSYIQGGRSWSSKHYLRARMSSQSHALGSLVAKRRAIHKRQSAAEMGASCFLIPAFDL